MSPEELRSRLAGVATALVTPMLPDGAVDFDALDKHLDWMRTANVRAVVPVGTTGESATLTQDERIAVIERCLAVAGTMPVIAGTGSNSTVVAIEQTKAADQAGADAVLVIAPYYNRPSQSGLLAHFRQVAGATAKPVIVYNVPSRTVVDLSVDTLARLVEACPHVIGIKDAAGHDLGRVVEVRTKIGSDFIQLSGDDATYPGFLALGGHGAISVVANIAPELMAKLQAAWDRGDHHEVVRCAQQCVLLQRLLFSDSSPAPTKYILSKLRRMQPTVRLPLVELDSARKDCIDRAYRQAVALAG